MRRGYFALSLILFIYNWGLTLPVKLLCTRNSFWGGVEGTCPLAIVPAGGVLSLLGDILVEYLGKVRKFSFLICKMLHLHPLPWGLLRDQM